ncbi:Lipocalin-like domain-containing protein [Sphingobium faniae]|nr:Lipocalin-like domain-containing protein [Sphingobium faniae]
MLKKEDLLGTWSLARAFETRDGRVVDPTPLGLNPSGFIHYLDDDRMAVVIAQDGRKPLSGPRRSAPVEELAQSARSLDAYAGPYTVKGEEDVVVHHLEISSFQNDMGVDYVRTVEFIDGELYLGTPEFRVADGIRGMKLVWKRLD